MNVIGERCHGLKETLASRKVSYKNLLLYMHRDKRGRQPRLSNKSNNNLIYNNLI